MEQSKLLEQLNRFTRRKHTAQEVYMFDVILCDNEVDRDGECFTKQALETLCRRFEGVTGIFDHDPKGSRQTARIFATELVEDPARRTAYGAAYTYLKACAYMIRTDSNQDLIREIDGGIKKEVSVSCAAKTSRCSVCGSTGACAHEKGKVYGGRLCYRELEDISDVYEWSFVAVPAQVHAGVTKQYGASGGEDPVRKALQAQLDKLRGTAQDDPLCLPWVKELLASGQLAELDRPTVAAAIREIRVYEGNRMEIDYLLPESYRALLER